MMKAFHSTLILLSVFTSIPQTNAGELTPVIIHENLSAIDDSVQQCFVFTCKPGVLYRIERSNDLSEWSALEEVYGLGHEHVTAMREYTLAPPPPPGEGTEPPSGPGIVRLIGLRFQNSTESAAHTVVSWRSLDHGGPVIRVLEQPLSEDWDTMPLFAANYGSHCFLVACGGLVEVAPPPELTPLGAKDTVMWEDLEEHFAAMNQAVENSVALARMQPPPSPPDPDAKRFWRVHCDWSLDTDHDGSPDWMEFEMAAQTPNAGGTTLRGDPFDADTNRNGIPDGEELDYDGDGIPDARDAGKDDPTATVEIGPVPRYALFPITNANIPAWDSKPWQINDLGTVLYSNGTWTGGAWTALDQEDGALKWCVAKAINDEGVILGTGTQEVAFGSQEGTQLRVCFWSGPAAVPQSFQIVSGEDTLFPSPSYDFAYGELRFGEILSSSGVFLQPIHRVEGLNYPWVSPGEWTLPDGDNPGSAVPSDLGLMYLRVGGLKWGHRSDPQDPLSIVGGRIKSGAQTLDLDFIPRNVATLPAERILAMPGTLQGHAKVHSNGAWAVSPTLAAAIDISDSGICIGRNHAGLVAPVLINGKWYGLERTAPDTPEGWKGPGTRLVDTTAGGWILALRDGTGLSQIEAAVMLPLEIKGYAEDPALAPEATGVDEFSIGARSPGLAVRDRIWIMAPASEGQTRFHVKSPLNTNSPLKLSGTELRFDGAMEETVASDSADVWIESWSDPQQSYDTEMILKFGDTASSSAPIGVKIMKDRIVRVKPFLVAQQKTGEPDNPPDVHPSREQLELYLNAVFRPQLNATFVVESFTSLSVAWDVNDNQSLEQEDLDATGAELDAILQAASSHVGIADHIQLYFVGAEKKIQSDKAWGLAVRSANACWVLGEALEQVGAPGSGRTVYDVMQTAAHEIGHLLVGYGHPDQGGGEAPLHGTNHRERLMHSGDGLGGAEVGGVYMRNRRGHRLVKAEWDKAEEWLRINIQ